MMTVRQMVLSTLQNASKGATLTQMSKKAKTTEATVAARIAELRSTGYAIYARRNMNNENVYTLDSNTPSKRTAQMYRSNGSSAFFAS